MLDRIFRESLLQLGKLGTDLPAYKFCAAIIGACIHYLLPIQDLRNTAVALFALIITDTVTGIWAAIKIGTKISSRRLSDIFGKIVAYGAVLMVLSIVPRTLPGLSETARAVSVGVGLGVMILAESVSILENVSTMGYKLLGFTTLFKSRLTKAGKDLIHELVTKDLPAAPAEETKP